MKPNRASSPATRILSDAENRHAVDLIEMAERETPHCLCGEAAAAIARGDEIWLECTSLRQPRRGLAGLLSRVSGGFGHTRRVIVELAA